MKMTNTKLAKFLIKLSVYVLGVVASYFALGSIFSDSTITIELNWVKLLVAIAIIGLAEIIYHWFYPCNRNGGTK